MTDTRDDPRYIRMIGLTLLAALLVVASCQVEQVSITVDVEQVTPEASTGAPFPSEITIEIPLTPEQIRARADEAERLADQAERVVDQAERVAELEAELDALLRARRAQSAAAEVRIPITRRTVPRAVLAGPTGAGAEADGPIFTPMTVRPEILNRPEIIQALMREYPPLLRDAGIGGTVEVWLFISDTGQVLDSRVSESSTYPQFDAAALRVARVFQFSPAMNRDRIVPVWIQLPITFEVRNGN